MERRRKEDKMVPPIADSGKGLRKGAYFLADMTHDGKYILMEGKLQGKTISGRAIKKLLRNKEYSVLDGRLLKLNEVNKTEQDCLSLVTGTPEEVKNITCEPEEQWSYMSDEDQTATQKAVQAAANVVQYIKKVNTTKTN